MIISSKGRYALRVMLELAQYGGDGAYIRLGDIAQRQGISRKYLESIMTALAKAGLVESALGKAGGYRLVRPAEDYPIGEILQAAEGELMPVSCLAMDGKPAIGRAPASHSRSGGGWRSTSTPTSTATRSAICSNRAGRKITKAAAAAPAAGKRIKCYETEGTSYKSGICM